MGTAIQQQDQQISLAHCRGTHTDPGRLNKLLYVAAVQGNLISPAPSVGSLPVGCEVALNLIQVDPADCYRLTGGFGLSKSTLNQLGHALGVSWDPRASGRVDDGSNPYYVRWRAVGYYRAFDGQKQVLHAEKELDLREGSPTCEALHEQQRRKNKPNADNQIREMRMHIQSHAETKAQLRAIRSLGIKTSYEPEQLRKPFITARVVFTGRTDDPELRRDFAHKIADSFLASGNALYGDVPAALPAPVPPPGRQLHAPPPVGSVKADPDDYAPVDDDFVANDTSGRYVDQPKSEPPPAPKTFTLPAGKNKGTPISEATDRDLNYWIGRFKSDLEDDSKERFHAKTRQQLEAFQAEVIRRQEPAHEAEHDDGPAGDGEPKQGEMY